MKLLKVFLVIGSIGMVWFGRKQIVNTAVSIPILRKSGVRIMMSIPYFRKKMVHSIFSQH
ncbi:hypothetical protein [Gracilibacillus alcaliphilus]|uniref:hypothetical protein n=1 Tax=Gracilibacillus alcaliphilus TaxID=1401441 RepID=UPI00195F0061|nr:hypothetical protein [Gracilibacillus alcaliphilus]MBM7675024.1 uncharacterized protein YneF (UPF0154 family) [Gracilibacillus alcaliphilus]